MIEGLGETITINMAKPRGISIICGTWYADHLGWDEALGTLAALIVPERRSGVRIGYLQPAMKNLQYEIRRHGLIETFGDSHGE
jgi:hypothetical protein